MAFSKFDLFFAVKRNIFLRVMKFNLNSLIFTFSRDLLFLSFLSLREVSTTDR